LVPLRIQPPVPSGTAVVDAGARVASVARFSQGKAAELAAAGEGLEPLLLLLLRAYAMMGAQ